MTYSPTNQQEKETLVNDPYEINEVSAFIGSLNIQGNVVPHSWFKHIRNETGKPDSVAILLLSEIIYWYRPYCVREGADEVWKKRYKADLLQKSYAELEEKFGFTKRQLVEAFITLEKHGLAFREFRTIHVQGLAISNVLFININPFRIKEITYSDLKKYVPSHEKTGHPPTKNVIPPNKKRDTYTESTSETTQRQQQQPPPSPQGEQRGASAPEVAVVAFYECLKEVGISDEEKRSLTAQFSEAIVAKAVKVATHPSTVIKKTLIGFLVFCCKNPETITIPEDSPHSAIDPKKLSEINRKKALQIIKDYQSKANEMHFKIYEDGHQLFIKFTPIAYDDPRFNEMVERYLKEAKLR